MAWREAWHVYRLSRKFGSSASADSIGRSTALLVHSGGGGGGPTRGHVGYCNKGMMISRSITRTASFFPLYSSISSPSPSPIPSSTTTQPLPTRSSSSFSSPSLTNTSTDTKSGLSPSDVAAFQRDGAICIRNAFSPEWIAALERGVRTNLAEPGQFMEILGGDSVSEDESITRTRSIAAATTTTTRTTTAVTKKTTTTTTATTGRFINDYLNWRRIPEYFDFIFNSPSAALVGSAMKSKCVAIYHEHLLIKEPGAASVTPWHHDQPYYPVNGDQVVSLWVPLDPVPRDTCVRFVAGSHATGKWYIPRKFSTSLNYDSSSNNCQSSGGDSGVDEPPSHSRPVRSFPGTGSAHFCDVPDIDNDDNVKILTWELNPGDAILFHARTLHGAPSNPSSCQNRRALATRWLGDDAVFATRPWNVSPPLTGGRRPGQTLAGCVEFPIVWTATS